MSEYPMGTIEAKFADIIWEREPIPSTELVRIAAAEFDWKKSTTYTVLKRLCEKGIFKNEGGSVTGVITKDDFYAARSEQFVEETFGGSLPAFIAAFTKRKALSKSELDELRRMVEEYEEDSK